MYFCRLKIKLKKRIMKTNEQFPCVRVSYTPTSRPTNHGTLRRVCQKSKNRHFSICNYLIIK